MSTIFIDEVQAANILQQMWQECETDQFCDVILISGEIKIPAHRAILSTATGYFKGMFTSLRESREKEIKMSSVDGHALKSLIEFFYTGRVEIREDNVEELLKTADMLLLNNVVEACSEFLVKQLHQTNCLGFMVLAEQFLCQSLLEHAEEYTLEHFMYVYKTQEFLKLNSEQLGQLLANDNLRVTSEEHVFHSLLLWLEHERCEREKYAEDLLKFVRLPLLDPMFLDSHVKPVCTSTASLQLYIEAKEWQSLQDPSVLSFSISTKSRKSFEHLIGITLSKYNEKMYIHYYCPQRLKWMKWINDLEYREKFAVATMGHNIYIAGGRNATGNVLNTVICLNMETMTLSPVKSMTTHRSGCRAAVLNGFLYVAGGHYGPTYCRSVERWDPKTNAWNNVASMSVVRCSFGFGEFNKKLYAVGGNQRTGEHSSAEYYDSDKNVWTSIGSLNRTRYAQAVAVANSHLYAAGLKTVERYDSVTNQWSIISILRKALLGLKFLTFHNKLVVFYSDHVDECDARTNEWKTNESLKSLPRIYCIFPYSDELLITDFAKN